jgi:hypothetical protein
MNKPSIVIERLVVLNFLGSIACDLSFNNGLNIINGENSSGKSTILDFIAYTLGAENINFKHAALKCTHSYLQIKISQQQLTLMREVNNKNQTSMSVFLGTYEDAINNNATGWMTFPYKNSQDKFSFSKLIFEFLDYPIPLATDSIITMHQILRIAYADQMYTHPIFKFEKWDSSEKREAVKDFIFGIYTDERYDLQLQLKQIKKDIESKNHELKSINDLVERSYGKFKIDEINELISKNKEEKEKYVKKIKNYESEYNKDNINLPSQIIQQDELKILLVNLNNEIIQLEKNILDLQFDITDSQNFIKELAQRDIDIQNAKNTQKQIQDFQFKFCPSCYNPVQEKNLENSNCCHLCSTPTTNTIEDGLESISALLKMQTEILFQKEESERLLAKKRKALYEKNINLAEKKTKILELESEFNTLTSNWHTQFELGVIHLHREISKIDSEIINYQNVFNILNEIQILGNEKNELTVNKNRIETRISSISNNNFHRREKVSAKLNYKLKELLQQDLPRQDEFINPDKVQINFEDNIIFINDVGYFSQSSLVLIRHLFHLALLSVSNKDLSMRFPQLLILDGLNDGGLEAKRAFNLQHIILNESSKLNKNFQIIAATSEISDELNLSNYIIASYTEKNRSLNLA